MQICDIDFVTRALPPFCFVYINISLTSTLLYHLKPHNNVITSAPQHTFDRNNRIKSNSVFVKYDLWYQNHLDVEKISFFTYAGLTCRH